MLRPLLFAALLAAAPSAQEGKMRAYKDFKMAILKANTSKEIALGVGKRIDNFCGVFQAFYDELGLDKKSDNKVVARLFDTQAEFEQYYRRSTGEDDPPLAFFSPALNALVLYNDEANVTLRQTLFHECSHQFLNRYTAEAPKWLNEGLAEYFEGWRMTPEGTLVEKRTNLFDLKLLQNCLNDGKFLRPRDLVSFTRDEFDDYKKNHPELHPYLHYATAWSLMWFSLECSEDKKDRARVLEYMKRLCSVGENARFEMKDWDDFEARWKKAVLALTAEPVEAVDYVLLAGGYQEDDDWEAAAKLFEGALAKDPKIAGARFELGYCYKRLGDYDKAMEAFEAARKAEPKNPTILYWMARIVLRVDQEDPKDADPARALLLAQEALKLAGTDSPGILVLIARCQAAAGDTGAADKTMKKVIKLAEEDEKPYYEALARELKGK